jgi:hypothetical protein
MAVTFSGKWAKNSDTFGINFEAQKDADRIICVVSTDALQDIQPDNSTNSVEQQFLANQVEFQAIAEKLIRAGQYKDGFLYIHSQHLAA